MVSRLALGASLSNIVAPIARKNIVLDTKRSASNAQPPFTERHFSSNLRPERSAQFAACRCHLKIKRQSTKRAVENFYAVDAFALFMQEMSVPFVPSAEHQKLDRQDISRGY